VRWPAERSAFRRSPQLAVLYVAIALLGIACQIAGAIIDVKWLGLIGALVLAVAFVLFLLVIFRARPGEGGLRNRPS